MDKKQWTQVIGSILASALLAGGGTFSLASSKASSNENRLVDYFAGRLTEVEERLDECIDRRSQDLLDHAPH